MITVYLYNKNKLENVIEQYAISIEDYRNRTREYYPDFDENMHVVSAMKFQNPVLSGGKIREMTKDELYKNGKYQLSENELIENGKIKTVSLSEYEYIENNQIKFKREEKIEALKKELYTLRLEYDTAAFEFEVDGVTYLQNNRSIDQSNLTRIVVMCQAMKKTTFENWKFYTKDNSEKYVNISLQDMMKMANIMQEQTTKSMATETLLSHNLENLTDEELKNYNAQEKYGEAYNSVN